ncbi:MAG TPA: hypothetical protein VF173_28455 [Thermoanaerobaculia bacterium]|nr:hypothetical protein [Thermoanaerobaculia bacterium]
MPGPPVSLGCAVILTPGAAGPPDSGVISSIPQTFVTAGGQPLAVSGSLCQMVNSVSGAPYVLPVGPGGSASLSASGAALLRVGDQIPSGPGILSILGPPAAPYLSDTGAP